MELHSKSLWLEDEMPVSHCKASPSHPLPQTLIWMMLLKKNSTFREMEEVWSKDILWAFSIFD